jgi:histidyl-tRNA synthetase
LVELLDDDFINRSVSHVDAYLILLNQDAQRYGLQLAEKLRDQLPELRLQVNAGGGSMKSQMKKADKSQASLALILGEDEMASSQITIKHLRSDETQQTISQADLTDWLKQFIN